MQSTQKSKILHGHTDFIPGGIYFSLQPRGLIRWRRDTGRNRNLPGPNPVPGDNDWYSLTGTAWSRGAGSTGLSPGANQIKAEREKKKRRERRERKQQKKRKGSK